MNSVAAIYLPGDKDILYHASMSCCRGKWNTSYTKGPVRITKEYHVDQVWNVRRQGKFPCPECWVPGGYNALIDPLADWVFE